LFECQEGLEGNSAFKEKFVGASQLFLSNDPKSMRLPAKFSDSNLPGNFFSETKIIGRKMKNGQC